MTNIKELMTKSKPAIDSKKPTKKTEKDTPLDKKSISSFLTTLRKAGKK